MGAAVRVVRLGSLADAQASSSIHSTVPPVLDRIVTSAMKTPSNFGPSLAHVSDETFNKFTFFGCDGLVVERRLEILVVAFPALLW